MGQSGPTFFSAAIQRRSCEPGGIVIGWDRTNSPARRIRKCNNTRWIVCERDRTEFSACWIQKCDRLSQARGADLELWWVRPPQELPNHLWDVGVTTHVIASLWPRSSGTKAQSNLDFWKLTSSTEATRQIPTNRNLPQSIIVIPSLENNRWVEASRCCFSFGKKNWSSNAAQSYYYITVSMYSACHLTWKYVDADKEGRAFI